MAVLKFPSGAPTSDLEVNPVIRAAIEKRRLLSFRFKGRERIVEPHDYGVHNGDTKLFAYQVGGESSAPLPNWRWFEESGMSVIRMLETRFPGGRPTKTGKHQHWDKLFIRVRQAGT